MKLIVYSGIFDCHFRQVYLISLVNVASDLDSIIIISHLLYIALHRKTGNSIFLSTSFLSDALVNYLSLLTCS